MNISGLLITTNPKKTKKVVESLNRFEKLEIHKILEDGRIVAVLERETTEEEVKVVKELHDIDGVSSVVMAYHYFEEENIEGTNKAYNQKLNRIRNVL